MSEEVELAVFPKPTLPPGYHPNWPFVPTDWLPRADSFYAWLTKPNTFQRWAKFLSDVTIEGWLYAGQVSASSIDVEDLNAGSAVIGTLGATSGAFGSLTSSSSALGTASATTLTLSGALVAASLAISGAITAASLAVTGTISGASLAVTGAITGASGVITGQWKVASLWCTGNALIDSINATSAVLGGLTVTGLGNIVNFQSTNAAVNTLTVNSSATIPVLTVLTSATTPLLTATTEQVHGNIAIAGSAAVSRDLLITGQTLAQSVTCTALTCTSSITAPNIQRTAALIYLNGLPVPNAPIPIVTTITNTGSAFGGIDVRSQLATDGSGTNIVVYPGFCLRFFAGPELLFECANATADMKWAVVAFSPSTMQCDTIRVFFGNTQI